jgi:hypothetical protein
MNTENQSHLAAGDGPAVQVQAPSIDLQRFCWADDYRKHLRTPWAHKGHIYATNGHICVRVPAPDQAEAIFPHAVGDSAAGIFDKVGERQYAPLPEFEMGETCHVCRGKGKYPQSKCEDCDGDGVIVRGRHEYECKECDGDGWVDDSEGEMRGCPLCDGYGTRSKCIDFAGGVGYQARYLNLIKDLPGLMFATGGAVDDEHRTIDTIQPAHFTFDGGEGVLMPMRGFAS